jgi:enoyl-CoA hydratase/carnithine racemase
MSEFLMEYEIRDGMAGLCLTSPLTLNACSDNMWAGLIKELTRALCEAQAIVLASLGRGCSPGANPGKSAAGKPATETDAGQHLDAPIQSCGGAAPRAQAFIHDRRERSGVHVVAAESAYIRQGFSRIDLVPDADPAYPLADSVERIRAMEATLLIEKIGARQTMELRLIDRTVPDRAVLDANMKLTSRAAYDPTYAQNPARHLAWFALEDTVGEQLAFEQHGSAWPVRVPISRQGCCIQGIVRARVRWCEVVGDSLATKRNFYLRNTHGCYQRSYRSEPGRRHCGRYSELAAGKRTVGQSTRGTARGICQREC